MSQGMRDLVIAYLWLLPALTSAAAGVSALMQWELGRQKLAFAMICLCMLSGMVSGLFISIAVQRLL